MPVSLSLKDKNYFVYIIGNERPTLYIGVTNDLVKRVYEHKKGIVSSFTKKYSLNKILYFEIFNHIEDALKREKQLKHWNRNWKLEIIIKENPNFEDLYEEIVK